MRVPEKTLKVATGLQLTTGSSCFSGRVRMFECSNVQDKFKLVFMSGLRTSEVF